MLLDQIDDHSVVALFEHIKKKHRGLDLLVSSAFNGNGLRFKSELLLGGVELYHWVA